MMLHPFYRPQNDAETRSFLESAMLGRLVTGDAEGFPRVGLFNFLYREEEAGASFVELHLNARDAQIADLKARARCAFEVSEPLCTIPSYWVDVNDGGRATMYYRAVVLRCEGEVIDDPLELQRHLGQLLMKHQPEGGHAPLSSDTPFYAQAFALLRCVRLRVVGRDVKFKLGQNLTDEKRAQVQARLEEKADSPNHAKAAALLAADRQRR